MSIEDLNLLAHASSAILPILTRMGSIPRVVDLMTSTLPMAILPWHAYCQYSKNNEASQFIAKFTWRLLECLTLGHALSQMFVPEILGKETNLLADAGVLAAGAIGSFCSLQIGITGRDRTLDIPYTSLAQRAIFSVIGTLGLAQVVDAIKNISLGLFAVQSLDPEQQYFVLKHRSLESFGGRMKSCRAVIIDGVSSEWGDRIDDFSWPLVEELYRNCEVRTYRVDPNSTVPVCDAAEKGTKVLGRPVDILTLMGHANENLINLHKDTFFTGSSDETACLRDQLQSDAQMILAGCNTATGYNSLAEKVSRHLNGIEVIGFSGYFAPQSSTTSWDGKKLSLWSYFPLDNQGNWILDNQGNWIFQWSSKARTFKRAGNAQPQ
jgi:hypothetical protein